MMISVDNQPTISRVQSARLAVIEEILNSLLLATAVLLTVSVAFTLIFTDAIEAYGIGGTAGILTLVGAMWIISLSRKISFRIRATFFLIALFLLTIASALPLGLNITAQALMLLTIILAFILLGFRSGLILLIISSILLMGLGFVESAGLFLFEGEIDAAGVVMTYLLALTILFYGTNKLIAFSKAIEEKQTVLRSELDSSKENLESEVLRQTHALATASDISRRLLTIYNQHDLLTSVVTSLKDAFDYYHVHIYLLDEEKNVLRMMAGSGEVGTALFATGHTVPVGKGLVGQAALMNITIYVPDVSKDENWLPNSLLPNTKSEIVVPISFGGKVLGVLDVQDNELEGLLQEDVNVLETVGIELGVALRNSEIYQIARERAAKKSALNEISRRIRQAETVEETIRAATEGLGNHFRFGEANTSIDMGQFAQLLPELTEEATHAE